MAYNETGRKATNKYRSKFDTIEVRVPKGDRKIIAEHAASHDGSVNSFIIRAIRETIERDNESV